LADPLLLACAEPEKSPAGSARSDCITVNLDL